MTAGAANRPLKIQSAAESKHKPDRIRIGLVSDTHGLLRPEAAAFLSGCDAIIHAGDICDRDVLDALQALAPVTAVRGNNDRGEWADSLQESEIVRFSELVVYVIHDLGRMAIDPSLVGAQVVVSGHSHKPLIEERGGVLFINPGSAGPRRFNLPISAAELLVTGKSVTARLVNLVGDVKTAGLSTHFCPS